MHWIENYWYILKLSTMQSLGNGITCGGCRCENVVFTDRRKAANCWY